MPTKLSEPLVQDALTRLTGWTGDELMIHREFVLDGLPRERLLEEIEALADSTDHTIMLTDTSTGLDVSLATTDVDGVSEVDIAMAARLNDLFLLSTAIPQPRAAEPEETVAETPSTNCMKVGRKVSAPSMAKPTMKPRMQQTVNTGL